MIGPAKTSRGASIRHNNFDLIRLLAASQVVLFHGMEHLGPRGASHSFVGQLLSWFPGVPVFFVVSGFLVSLSFERAPSVGEYFRNRALRIFPALWVCLVFALATVLLFGMPLRSSPGLLQVAGWWAAQMSVVQFYNPDFLRDYGVGVLNGSLWTIPVELQYYAVLPLLYVVVMPFKGKRAAWILLAIAALAMSVAIASWASVRTGSVAARLAYVSLAPYLYLFLLGLLLQRGFASAARWLDGKGAAVASHLPRRVRGREEHRMERREQRRASRAGHAAGYHHHFSGLHGAPPERAAACGQRHFLRHVHLPYADRQRLHRTWLRGRPALGVVDVTRHIRPCVRLLATGGIALPSAQARGTSAGRFC